MPNIKVNGSNIWYEAYGKEQTVLYLQSAWGGRNPAAYYIAGRLSKNFRTIIWDAPNAGMSSESVVADYTSEYHMCCEYINGLCESLGETKIHIAGCSGGGELALLFASLYPAMVKSIAMYRPSDTSCEVEQAIIRARYYALADIAESGGIKGIIEYSVNPPDSRWSGISKWVSEVVKKQNEMEKFLSYDPAKFASIMRKWGDWMSQKGFYKANLEDSKLKSIVSPALIVAAADPFHPEELAIELNALLPNSKYIPSPFFRTEQEMYAMPDEEHNFGGLPDFLNSYETFLLGMK